MCSCGETPWLCRIDAHATKYILENPEWEEEATKALPKPKGKPSDCVHRGAKELIELPGGIRSWLCKACKKELEERLQEVNRPATPIEMYAERKLSARRERGTKMSDAMEGCTYNVGRKGQVISCGMLAAAGNTMCPRHAAIWPVEQAEFKRKEDEKLENKRKKLQAKQGQSHAAGTMAGGHDL